MGLKAFGAIGL